MKLQFENVSKRTTGKPKKWLFQNLDFNLEQGKNLSLLTHSEEVRIQILRLLTGSTKPDTGKILRQGSISTPIGESAIFHGEMSVRDNMRFVCKLYGKNSTKVIKDVTDYIDNSVSLRSKTKKVNIIDKRKVSMALSLFLDLDVYIIRGDISHPEAHFKDKFEKDFMALLNNSAAITVSTNMQMLRKIVHSTIIINNQGTTEQFLNLEQGIAQHNISKPSGVVK